jgi:hypothetical protein
MSDKQKKFRPDAGFVVAVHQNILGIRAVASALDIFPEVLAEAMEEMGFQFIPDPFNLSSDAGKVIALQEKHKNAGLQVVQEPVPQEGPANE